MITRDNIKAVLLSEKFGFHFENGVFTKHFGSVDDGFDLEYNFNMGEFVYPQDVQADRNTTQDEHQNESFVVFICVAQLFERGYLPKNLKLEGKNYAGTDKGYCDILVSDNNGDPYLIIECKTANVDKKEDEFRKHWAKTMRNGDQLFRYFNTYRKARYLCLYAADFPEYKKNGEKVNRFENIYHIISLVDNEEYLQTDTSLRSFKEMREEQGGSEEFFNVWKNTYKQDYNTRGLLEEGIAAFDIGKKNYAITDLQTIDEYSLNKKYNEFALILRKHTISSHENAFDRLVNLFLAKIIDERYNQQELHLLWKGAAYDDYFSLQDRLVNLYKRGMKEFFDDEVASVENTEIDNAFKFLTAKADEARDTIKKYFRKLKYFNNNPFAFLDVHNEQLFYKNAVILKDTISMLQDIYLTKNTDNQFLGDLFEGFLNRGVHQSEGQFFTPIPIVRFLVSSLPLRQIIEGGEIPKAIDYACGAGHFLTEYARQIKPIVEEKVHVDDVDGEQTREERVEPVLKKYYEQIVGIEKDYRLSKVSQVAAFMYGMDGIRIHYGDGLEEIPGVKDHTYSVLVANPPYAVPGFLETLPEEDRGRYTLNKYVSNIEKNNSIETFFIERAAQLLKSGGVAAIVLPSSVLSKGGLYMRTRELVLKNFDIVSICCLGPNTFGQTNTKTVVLFLRRKALEPNLAKHVENRIEEWFNGNMYDNGAYRNSENLQAYVKHMGYKYDDYVRLLKGELTDSFLQTEMAQEYVNALNIKKQTKNSASTALATDAKKVRDEAQKYVKSRRYKELTPAGKALEEERYTIKFIRAIEKEKLYYYMLAASNPQPVLVVQSPSDKAQEKKFLGYEWSNRKGDEGIHYLNTGKIKEASSDDEAADDDTMEQIKSIDGIITPMFDALNLEDENKINAMIRKSYCGDSIGNTEQYGSMVRSYALEDMLDFTKVAFDKEIRTSVDTILRFNSLYPLVKIEKILSENPQYGANEKAVDAKKGDCRYIRITDIQEDGSLGNEWKTADTIENKYMLREGDLLFARSGATAGKAFYYTEKMGKALYAGYLIRFRFDSKIVLSSFVYCITFTKEYQDWVEKTRGGSAQPNINSQQYSSFEIPLPPMDIQKKIVEECGKIDDEVVHDKEKVLMLEKEIESEITSVKGSSQLLKSFMEFGNERIDYKDIRRETYVSTDNMLQNCEGVVPYEGIPNISNVVAYHKGDILLSNIRPYLKKLWMADCDGGCSPDVLVLHNAQPQHADSAFVYYSLRKQAFFDYVMSDIKGIKMPRGKKGTIEKFEIKLPSLEVQKEIVAKLQKLDVEIKEAKQRISSAPSRKQAILDKYLK